MRLTSRRAAGIVGLTMAGWLLPLGRAHAQTFSCPGEPFVFNWSLPDGATDVEVRSNGEVYVLISDITDHVNVYDYRGNFLRTFGTAGFGPGELKAPFDMTFDGQGNTYILEAYRKKILKFDAADQFVSEWNSDPDAPFQGTYGIFLGQDGFLYAVKPGLIYVFDSSGVVRNRLFLTGDPGPGYPFHLVRTPTGDFLIGFNNTAPGHFNIRKFNASGAYVAGLATHGSGPSEVRSVYDMYLDAAGNLYAVDSNFGASGAKVNVYDANGTYLETFGNESEKLLEPSGIAVREDKGTVYVTDQNAGKTFARVMVFNCQPAGAPTVSIASVGQNGGADLEVDGSVDDPDGEPLDVDVQMYCPAPVPVTLGSANAFRDVVAGESGAAIARPRQPGTGMTSDPPGHFDFACGLCDAPLTGFVSSLTPRQCGLGGDPEEMVDIDICARSNATGKLYSLDVTFYDRQVNDPNASYRRFQNFFSARHADQLAPYTVPATPIASALPVGETCELRLSALDYFTPRVTAAESLLYQGETRIVFPPFDAATLIGQLIALVEGLDLPPGIENSLVKKLENAQASLDDGNVAAACGKIGAFINEVRAQSGKKLTTAQANQLVAEAEAIKTVLGCP